MLLRIKGVIAAFLDMQCHSFKIATRIAKVVLASQRGTADGKVGSLYADSL